MNERLLDLSPGPCPLYRMQQNGFIREYPLIKPKIRLPAAGQTRMVEDIGPIGQEYLAKTLNAQR